MKIFLPLRFFKENKKALDLYADEKMRLTNDEPG
jgi:hypothetical protein